MALQKEYVRLIFGIKLKQFRSEKQLSLHELSVASGISISYLNEIEKGKKYPKPEKIEALGKVLGIDQKDLTSEHLDNELAPVAELFKSGILGELPLEVFGLEASKLLELLANAPSKLNAFIGTLLEISRNYDLRVETFYFSVMRSYQEIHKNYFEDLESQAERFLDAFEIDRRVPLTTKKLEAILKNHFNYSIEYRSFDEEPLRDLRSLMIPKKRKPKLILNKGLDARQKGFILGKEIGYKFMNLKERTYTSTWVEIDSFEQVLNNFKASYFSSAILINRTSFLVDLDKFFSNPKWDPNILVNTMMDYNATPEMVLQRMTNLLPQYFRFKELFFFRFNNAPFSGRFELSKELHIAREHTPRGTVLQEHFCRRWMFISILDDLAKLHLEEGPGEILGGAQIAKYLETGEKFLVFSLARSLEPTPGINSSLALGIKIDDTVEQKIKFIADSQVRTKLVNDTCERCSAKNCRVRAAPPRVFQQLKKEADRKSAIKKLTGNI